MTDLGWVADAAGDCVWAAQAVFTGNDWHHNWVADTVGDCAQDDLLHIGGAGLRLVG
jgi:hypothetical protein